MTTELFAHAIADPEINGMTRAAAWVYIGGFGLAGMHVEDAFLYFINISILVGLSFSPEVDDLSKSVMRKAIEIASASAQTWIFAPSAYGRFGSPRCPLHIGHGRYVAHAAAFPPQYPAMQRAWPQNG